MKSDWAHFSTRMQASFGRVGLVVHLAHPAVSRRSAEVEQVALAKATVIETAGPVLGWDLLVEADILLAGIVVIVNEQLVNLGFRAVRSELAHIVLDVLLELDKRLSWVDFDLKVENVALFKLNAHHQDQPAVVAPIQVCRLLVGMLSRVIVVTELLLLSTLVLLLLLVVWGVASSSLPLLLLVGSVSMQLLMLHVIIVTLLLHKVLGRGRVGRCRLIIILCTVTALSHRGKMLVLLAALVVAEATAR